MGTNYYWHDRPCSCCGRHDEIHVCKSQASWRAYRTMIMNDEHPDWGNIQTSPFGFDVVSIDDWRRVFTERSGELYDEYGRRIDDPVAWLAGVQPLDDAARIRYRGWHAQELGEHRAWFAGGFYFADYEFS